MTSSWTSTPMKLSLDSTKKQADNDNAVTSICFPGGPWKTTNPHSIPGEKHYISKWRYHICYENTIVIEHACFDFGDTVHRLIDHPFLDGSTLPNVPIAKVQLQGAKDRDLETGSTWNGNKLGGQERCLSLNRCKVT